MGSPCLIANPDEFNEELLPAVQAVVRAPIRERVLGATLTTFAIGAAVRAVVSVESVRELSDVLTLLYGEGQPVRVIGNGSNILFGDEPVGLWLIKLAGEFRRVEFLGSGELEAYGAVPLMSLARKVSDDGLSGLEFAAGIPASLGGATYMNAGAHGSEVGSRVVEVNGLLPDGSRVVWSSDDLPWRYRFSGIPMGAVVTSVRLRLVPGDQGAIAAACAHNLAERRARQPLSVPSAGSVFKNPSPERPAGRILEEVGMKGYREGGAAVSELHANWIVNPRREASAKDVIKLIGACQERAKKVANVALEPEVQIWARTEKQ